MERKRQRAYEPVAAVALSLTLVLCLIPALSSGSSPSSASASFSIAASIPLGESLDAFGPSYDDVTGTLYVSGWDGAQTPGTVFAISGATNSVVATTPVGVEPSPAAIDSASGNVYVSNAGRAENSRGTVSELSGATNSVIRTTEVWYDPATAAYDPANNELYVPNSNLSESEGSVSVLSAANASLQLSIPVGIMPSDVLYDDVNGDLYVLDSNRSASGSADQISVISGATNTVIDQIGVGSSDSALLLDAQSGDIYEGTADGIVEVSGATNEVEDNFAIAAGLPSFFDASGNLYVLQPGNPARVSVISPTGSSVVTSFSLGDAGAMSYDPNTNEILSTVEGSDVVNLTSDLTHELVGTVDLGAGYYLPAVAPFFDPGNGDVYVTQYGPSLSVIALGESPTNGTSAGSSSVWLFFLAGIGVGGVAGAGAAQLARARRVKAAE